MALIPVTEQNADRRPPGELHVSRGRTATTTTGTIPDSWRASMSYVTGAHSFKVGYQGYYALYNTLVVTNDPLLAVPVPERVPESASPSGCRMWRTADRTFTDGLFVQDTWTRGRLTLQGALRFDHAWSFSPAEGNGTDVTSRFNAAPITFARTPGVDCLQRPHAADRRRLRRVRQRQDGDQVQLGPLSLAGDQRRPVHAEQSRRRRRKIVTHRGPQLGRHQRQLRRRLRHPQSGGADRAAAATPAARSPATR